MPFTLELIEKHFETRDAYKALGVSRDALKSEITKAYCKLVKIVNPDFVAEEAEATEKFEVLSKIFFMLTDPAKRSLYDAQGTVDDGDDFLIDNWMIVLRAFKACKSNHTLHTGSKKELKHIIGAYLRGDVSEDKIFNILWPMIVLGEVPENKTFTEESKQKQQRRMEQIREVMKEGCMDSSIVHASGEVTESFSDESKQKRDQRRKRQIREAMEEEINGWRAELQKKRRDEIQKVIMQILAKHLPVTEREYKSLFERMKLIRDVAGYRAFF